MTFKGSHGPGVMVMISGISTLSRAADEKVYPPIIRFNPTNYPVL